MQRPTRIFDRLRIVTGIRQIGFYGSNLRKPLPEDRFWHVSIQTKTDRSGLHPEGLDRAIEHIRLCLTVHGITRKEHLRP